MRPAERLRVATDLAQADWAKRWPKVAGVIATDVAGIDDPHQALVALKGKLRVRTREAHQPGAQQVNAAVQAAGVPGIVVRTTLDDAFIPVALPDAITEAWVKAGLHEDPLAFRRNRVAAITDRALSGAHDAGTGLALDRHPRVVGYRRVTRGGACSACFTLITGRVETNPSAFPRHPRCRCFMEPVIQGINDDRPGRPTRDDAWHAMTHGQQNNLFTGTPETRAAKADLVRNGHVTLDDVVQYQPRRPGQRPLPEEASLTHLQLLAARRHVTRVGLVHPDTLNLPKNLTPAAATEKLWGLLREAAEKSWDADDENLSWALDGAFDRAVTMPDRAFDHIRRHHREVAATAGLRTRVLKIVQTPEKNGIDGKRANRHLYLVRRDSGWVRVVVEYHEGRIMGEAFNTFFSRGLPNHMR